MAYVPPALRKKQHDTASNGEAKRDNPVQRPTDGSNGFHQERLPRAEDVHAHYWPLDGGADQHMNFAVHSTLNSARAESDRLKYVMLFKDANPRWQTDRIIYVKTNLHLLPGSEKFAKSATSNQRGEADGAAQKPDDDGKTDETLSEQRSPPIQTAASDDSAGTSETTHTPDLSANQLGPIAIFEQVGNRSGGFRFAGYHRIVRLQFLEPCSQALVRILEQKFNVVDRFGRAVQQQRSPEAWKASLEHRWAVIQLDRNEEADKSLPAPVVKIGNQKERVNRNKEEAPKKSVNELLKEMRLGKAEGETETDDRRPT